jgi:cysteinyl-tRNA synthetase
MVKVKKNRLCVIGICILLLLSIFSSGCTTTEDENEEDEETDDIFDYDHTDYTISNNILSDVNDWLYQLQELDLDAIGKEKFDLIVMDYSEDGSDETAFTKPEIEALKSSPGGDKVMISYISIGEAEAYRYYWVSSWKENPPSFIESENPDWESNYKVRYWEQDWQDIIFGSNNSYIDKIISAGFDGIYLDIIDAYEYFEEKGRTTAAREMVEFVKAISQYCKLDKGLPDFFIIPQNGEGLSVHQDYLDAVDGLGKEDLFYDGNDRQSMEDVNYSIQLVDNFKKAGKIVLSVDYCTNTKTIDDYYSISIEKGYIPYSTGRDLDRLTINPGHEPD